ncbi:chitin binding peritrophin-A domain-containing protein [Streptomyces monticola]|uniref:Chitin binding peritrophin-A domain-containing protein n=1 Tax=Streptomyces monticola TaxID=2666263 RepID=A0ABW2JDY1_9ACTN
MSHEPVRRRGLRRTMAVAAAGAVPALGAAVPAQAAAGDAGSRAAPAPAGEPVGVCPQVDGPYPVFLPDSEDKAVYYECSGGMPVVQWCPEGLHFNPALSTCTFPEDVPQPAERGPAG